MSSPRNYTFKLDEDQKDECVIWRTVVPYWRSVESEQTSDEMRYMIHSFLFNFNSSKSKTLQIQIQYGKTRQLVMNSSGEIQYYQDWYRSSPLWWAPRDQCSLSNACGKFGSCNANNGFMCKCLPRFEPVSPDGWKTGKFSSGCTRKSPVCEKNSSEHTFLSLKMMKV